MGSELVFPSGEVKSAPIVPGSATDAFGTHFDIYQVGGWRAEASIADRDLIPVTGRMETSFSSGRRRRWMRVYCGQEREEYQLLIPAAAWDTADDAGRIALLADNSYWELVDSSFPFRGTLPDDVVTAVKKGDVWQHPTTKAPYLAKQSFNASAAPVAGAYWAVFPYVTQEQLNVRLANVSGGPGGVSQEYVDTADQALASEIEELRFTPVAANTYGQHPAFDTLQQLQAWAVTNLLSVARFPAFLHSLSQVQGITEDDGGVDKLRLSVANGSISLAHLDAALQALLGNEAGDLDNVVNTLREMLQIMSTYPEGVDLQRLLADLQSQIEDLKDQQLPSNVRAALENADGPSPANPFVTAKQIERGRGSITKYDTGIRTYYPDLLAIYLAQQPQDVINILYPVGGVTDGPGRTIIAINDDVNLNLNGLPFGNEVSYDKDSLLVKGGVGYINGSNAVLTTFGGNGIRVPNYGAGGNSHIKYRINDVNLVVKENGRGVNINERGTFWHSGSITMQGTGGYGVLCESQAVYEGRGDITASGTGRALQCNSAGKLLWQGNIRLPDSSSIGASGAGSVIELRSGVMIGDKNRTVGSYQLADFTTGTRLILTDYTILGIAGLPVLVCDVLELRGVCKLVGNVVANEIIGEFVGAGGNSGEPGTAPTHLSDLIDVDVVSPTAGDVLSWDEGQQKWANQSPTKASVTGAVILAEENSADSQIKTSLDGSGKLIRQFGNDSIPNTAYQSESITLDKLATEVLETFVTLIPEFGTAVGTALYFINVAGHDYGTISSGTFTANPTGRILGASAMIDLAPGATEPDLSDPLFEKLGTDVFTPGSWHTYVFTVRVSGKIQYVISKR